MLGKFKTLLKHYLPGSVSAYVKAKEACRSALYRERYMSSVFSEIHKKNLWGNAESVSGTGSTLSATANFRRELPALLKSLDAATLLDAPCGDFNWMNEVALDLKRYVGADVVPAIIARNRQLYGRDGREFILADVTRDALPKVDVILCRDLLIHFSYKFIALTIENFKRSGSGYLLVTTDTTTQANRDILTGQWRPLNMQRHPFNFPPPLKLITENAESGRSVGLWRLKDL